MRPHHRPYFYDRGGMLEVAHDTLYLNNPHAILETFLVFQQTPGLQGLSRTHVAGAVQRTQRDGRRNSGRDPINRELFLDILRQPQRRDARASG